MSQRVFSRGIENKEYDPDNAEFYEDESEPEPRTTQEITQDIQNLEERLQKQQNYTILIILFVVYLLLLVVGFPSKTEEPRFPLNI